MKRLFIFYFVIISLFLGARCTSNNEIEPTPTPTPKPTPNTEVHNALNIDDCFVKTSPDKLEIVSWNIEHFPKKNEQTITEVARIIKGMNVDVLALQEIKNKESLDQLLELLPGYNRFIIKRTGENLAYIYKESEISLLEPPYGIYTKNRREFPRSPFVLPIHSKVLDIDILLVNNHFKAMSGKENEERRKAASKLLKEWMDQQMKEGKKIIALGDLNDELTDARENNVFQIFLDDTTNYLFADYDIAQEKNKSQWSYPGFPSHIDHFLITRQLFAHKDNVYTYTFGNCDSGYFKIVSDHYPICLVLKK